MNILFSQHVTDKMPSGLMILNREGMITGHNPASDRIFEDSEVTNRLLQELVRESHALEELLDRCLNTGEVFSRIEFNVPMRSGIDKRIGINLSPIISPGGQIEGAICLLSDLTEIVELQNQIKLKENFAALGEMSAGIAHEFKNSIATILGYAQMSKVEMDVATLQNYAREIHKESQALSNMITDFLNFARPVMASIYDVDLIELLKTVIGDVKTLRPGDYEVQFVVSGDALVPCDATLIRQSFLNLLINATEALEAKGHISVHVDAPAERDHVRVLVEDNGRGIPAHLISKIFFPFFTTKAPGKGTGLGLSVSYGIIQAHEGAITVESTPEIGTTFTILLPLYTETRK